MTVSVVVPRAGDCEHRARAWQWIRAQYDYEIVEGTGHPNRWCKAEAVDDALERATGDILAIVDADVWSAHLEPMIAAVQAGAPWAAPHTHVRRLSARGTEQFINGEREDAEVEEIHFATVGGGIVVLPRSTYEQIPLDSRFIGWGGEDKAWAVALHTLAGPPHRGDGVLWHLWHPPQPRRSRTAGSADNEALRARYIGARWSPKQLRQIVEEARACRSHGSSSSPSSSSCPA